MQIIYYHCPSAKLYYSDDTKDEIDADFEKILKICVSLSRQINLEVDIGHVLSRRKYNDTLQ